MSLAEMVQAAFAEGGALTRRFRGYRARPGQADLAVRIAEAMEQGGRLLAEAGTGSGKTLAYLVAAWLFDGKTLIATHTRALQDQLWDKDIPAIQHALGRTRTCALLKGRTNYACPYRIELHLRRESDPTRRSALAKIERWLAASADGDLAGAPFDVEAARIASAVTATSDQCLGARCPELARCPLQRARMRAQEADLVVVNHALLLADAALKAQGAADLLPSFDAYIFDEAHALEAAASQHFGATLSRRRLAVWLSDFAAECDALAGAEKARKAAEKLYAAAAAAWAAQRWDEVRTHWRKIAELSGELALRSEGLAKLGARAAEIGSVFEQMLAPPEGHVAWLETRGEETIWRLAPVETGPLLEAHLWAMPAAFVWVSATLRVAGSFAYIKQRLGADEAEEIVVPSPFDYRRAARIYIPKALPERQNDPGLARLSAEIEALLRASRGRAFVLFTSWEALRTVARRLAGKLPWPVLVQGEGETNERMLRRFREDTHSVLFGVRSFWEGVDVPGEALSLVVIDKLPFPPPDDPLLRARRQRLKAQGQDPFRALDLPIAAMTLRQGVGRLIRSEQDRGVIAILDSRLLKRGYGKLLLADLPPAPIVHTLAEVEAFFAGD